MPILKFEVNDKLILKKKHPCGFDTFTVAKGGTDVKIVCDSCLRSLTVSREKIEKTIKKVLPNTSNNAK